MAPLKNILLAASLLAPLTLAVPLVDKRGIFTHTKTEIVIVTVEETVTVWVNPDQATMAPIATVTSTANSPPAAAFHESGAPVPPAAAPSTFTTQPSPSAASPAPADTYVPPSSQPVEPAPTSAPVAAPSAPAPASASTAPAVEVQPKDVVASASADCEGTSSACVGDVTHWDGGLGACGWTVDTEAELAIALPYGLMGTQSNGNPYCGRKVTLVNPTSGTTVEASVGDKCMGCEGRAIDCTNKLFNAITDGTGDGRLSGIEWYFS